jgi:hypothetical protein
LNPTTAKISTVPRHKEINEFLARRFAGTWISMSPTEPDVVNDLVVLGRPLD